MTVDEAVEEILAEVREDFRERAYLFDDPQQAYRAGIEDGLIAAEERLAMQLEAAVHEQLDILAHEIATPASTVQMGVETLRSRVSEMSEADRGWVLDRVARNAEHLSVLVRDLRRPDADGLSPRVVAVETLVGEVVEDANAVFGAARIHFARSPDRVLATVDPHALRRILNALLSNAVKYGGDGEVTVTAEAADDRVEIRIADEGPGIPEDDREVVFEKFRQLDSQVPGSGLGLYLARDLAWKHGGDLTVESREHHPGAVLLLRLVRAIEVPEAADRDAPWVDRPMERSPR